MTTRDTEDDSYNTSSSVSDSDSSESINTLSEHSALLGPDLEHQNVSYKTSSITSPGSSQCKPIEAISASTASILGLLLIGVFISNADGSLVIATYATISSEFNSFGNAAWLATSYTLAQCAVQPIVGKLSDIYGRKGVLLSSYTVFALGSVWTGLSQSMSQIIAGRVISGIGAAGMSVIVSVLIADMVPMIQIAAWRSYVNVFATLGRSIGGPLGGFLADTVGWRLSFTGQGPIMVLAILLVAFKLPSQPTSETVHHDRQIRKWRRIDFIGAGLLALTILSFLSALSIGGQNLPWSSPIVLGLAFGGCGLLALFVFYETNFALEPIFPPSLVVQRDVATPYAIIALQTGAQVGMMFSVPLYFRVTEGASNTVAGAHLFPAVVGNAIGGLISGLFIQRTGRYKILTILATVSSSIGYLLLILRWSGKISLWESLEIVPGGFGSGIAQASTFIALTTSIDHKHMAIATGGIYLSSAIGVLTGFAVSSSVQLGTLRVLLAERVTGSGAHKVIEKVISDVGSIKKLDEPIRQIVIGSYVKSLEYSHRCALMALLISLTIREHRLS